MFRNIVLQFFLCFFRFYKFNKIRRVIEPVAILFSEYYFYLNAYIVEKDGKGRYVHKYDYPAIFRLNRIISHKRLGEKFSVMYASRFEEGRFWNLSFEL